MSGRSTSAASDPFRNTNKPPTTTVDSDGSCSHVSDYPVFSGPSYHQMTLSASYDTNKQLYQSRLVQDSSGKSMSRIHNGNHQMETAMQQQRYSPANSSGERALFIDRSIVQEHLRKKENRRWKLREIILICCTVFLFTVTIALIVIVTYLYSTRSTTTSNNVNQMTNNGVSSKLYCLNHACLKSAAQMKEMLEETIDPCKDMFQFSCNGWLKDNHIPPSLGSWSREQELQQSTHLHIRDIMEEPVEYRHPNSWEKKLKVFFESCISFGSGETIKQLTKQGSNMVNGDSQLDPLTTLIHLCKEKRSLGETILCWQFDVGIDTFYRLYVDTSPWLPKSETIFLDEYNNPDFPTLSELRDPQTLQNFKDLVSTLTNNVEYLGDNVGNSYANSVVSVLLSLANISLPISNQLKHYPKLRASKLTMMEFRQRFSTNYVIQFEKILSYFKYGNTETDVRQLQIAVGNIDYFIRLSNLLMRLRENEIKKFFEFSVIYKYAEYYKPETRAAVLKYRAFRQGAEHSAETWEPCLRAIRSPGVGTLFIRDSTHKPRTDQISINIIPYLRQALINVVNTKSNIQKSIKNVIVQKIHLMKIMLSHQQEHIDDNYLNNYYELWKPMDNQSLIHKTIAKDKWQHGKMKTRLKNNIYNIRDDVDLVSIKPNYYYDRNTVFIPAAYFQWPFFMWDDSMPFYLKFGIVGSTIATQMAKSLDSIGHQWTADGIRTNKRLSIMTEKMESCFKASMNRINKGSGLDIAFTETLGLEVASRAYQLYLSSNQMELGLPSVNYDPAEFLYISYTQKLCGKERNGLLNNPFYITQQTKIEMAIKHSDSFRRIFKCNVIPTQTNCLTT